MKTSSLAAALVALALAAFGGHAMTEFSNGIKDTANTSTSTSTDSVTGAFDAAFSITE